MFHQIVEISAPDYDVKASLYTYFLDSSAEMRPDEKRPVILICPGDGYGMNSDREAEPIAMQFLALGYHAAILRYFCAPAEYPIALLQVASTVLFLKERGIDHTADSSPFRFILILLRIHFYSPSILSRTHSYDFSENFLKIF